MQTDRLETEWVTFTETEDTKRKTVDKTATADCSREQLGLIS